MNGHKNEIPSLSRLYSEHSVEENWGKGRERKDRERESKGERKRERRDEKNIRESLERELRERAKNPKTAAFLG